MSILRIRLLGDFQLSYAGQPVVSLNTTRLQAFFVYLVLHRHAPQSRQHLAFLFWPDTHEAQALTNLRNLLHKLRQALPASEHFLLVDTQTVQWRPDAPFALDMAEFEAALTLATTRADLEAAVQHYQGDLLPSCYADWLLPLREQLRQRMIHALTQLIALLEAEGAYHAAIGYAQQLHRLDISNEAVYGQLMRLHAAIGDRAGVLRVYQTCSQTLQDEFAVEPAAATRALYQQLLQRLALTSTLLQTQTKGLSNLPLSISSFVGREQETGMVKALLMAASACPGGRLVTLTGTGGSGKTRLALHVATEVLQAYPDGVWWVELASFMDSFLVAQAVAKIFGVQETSGETLRTALVQALQNKQLLLVLDNCEHLVDACAQLAYALLSHCPKVHILATSRERLGITGEQFYHVPNLTLPGPQARLLPESLCQSEAIRLFVERAQLGDARFQLTAENAATILQICRCLDGIPLALELAAARLHVLSVEQIALRLDDRLSFLTSGSRTAPPRHQTLRATLDWSYELLTVDESLLFRRLAAFVGSFPLEAVEQVCGALPAPVLDVLMHLVEKSLVLVEHTDQGIHYRMLEIIRDYAREKLLASGEIEQLRLRHLSFFIKLAEATYAQLQYKQREHWLAWLERLHENIRIALRRATESGKQVEALRLASTMGLFWELRGYWQEGGHWLDQVLQMSEGIAAYPFESSDLQRWIALALQRAGAMAWRQCDFVGARRLLEQSLALDRKVNHWDGISAALGLLGGVAFEQGDYPAAQAYYTESLTVAHWAGTKHPLGMAYFCLGLVACQVGEYAVAHTHLSKSLALLREIEHSDVHYPLNTLGNLANLQGDYAAAQTYYAECLALRRKLVDKRGIAATLADIANLKSKQGDPVAAHTLYTESITLFREMGNQRGMVWGLSGLARLCQNNGHCQLAAKLSGAVDALLKALNARVDEPEASDGARAVALLRTQLGEANFNSAWMAGQHVTLEEAITLAQQNRE